MSMKEMTVVPVSGHARSALMKFLIGRNEAHTLPDAVEAALFAWLLAQGDAETELAFGRMPGAGKAGQGCRGYQWKSLFLPHGTRVRTANGRAAYLATVEQDKLVYQGRTVSPHQFVRATVGAGRNAWREIFLRLPGEKTWSLAFARRRAMVLAPDPASVDAAGVGTAAGEGSAAAEECVAGAVLASSVSPVATDALAAALTKIGLSIDAMLCLMEERTQLNTAELKPRHQDPRRAGSDRRLE